MSSLCIMSKLRCQLGRARGCTVVGTAFLMCSPLRVFLRDGHTGVSRSWHEAPLSLMMEGLLCVLRGWREPKVDHGVIGFLPGAGIVIFS